MLLFKIEIDLDDREEIHQEIENSANQPGESDSLFFRSREVVIISNFWYL